MSGIAPLGSAEQHADSRPVVLVVDDNTSHIELLRLALARWYRVLTASNGLEAYSLACQARPDAILLDLVMPVVDGYTILRKLRANPATARTPVVLVTGADADPHTLVDRAEVSAVLRKPCHQGEILEAIRSALPSPSASEN